MKTTEFCIIKKKEQEHRFKFLKAELDRLNKHINKDGSNVFISNRLFQVKNELEIFEFEKAKGARKRAKLEEIEKIKMKRIQLISSAWRKAEALTKL